MIAFNLVISTELPHALADTFGDKLGDIYVPLTRAYARQLVPDAQLAQARMESIERAAQADGHQRFTMTWLVEMQEPDQ
ncbi:hypothetical protein K2Z83_13480 [Oscillochloris sp. ZM17-4]|uniref:hypothetical protein n=1 Tax=Oscillochloris sp. ZM17-4 TaxID=2866714 RepID=UPI001C72D0E9|nr:hypothetical protein [Oscillochloris sp. ZM17-4]MBX0328688.1 hypothetical protein [Oscillochloris sp. ZM17-4]